MFPGKKDRIPFCLFFRILYLRINATLQYFKVQKFELFGYCVMGVLAEDRVVDCIKIDDI